MNTNHVKDMILGKEDSHNGEVGELESWGVGKLLDLSVLNQLTNFPTNELTN